MHLHARALPGLERILGEELTRMLPSTQPEVMKGCVLFDLREGRPQLRRLLACDSLSLLVRHAVGDFSGRRGLAELRSKLSRTEFARDLARLPEFGLGPPETFRVRASISPACDFAFFDVNREATPILEHRLGLRPVEGSPDVIVDIECSAADSHVGFGLHLIDWADARRRAIPRSLAGALVHLARAAPHVAVCDPDCGSGELLQAWRVAAGPAKAVGLSLGRRRGEPAVPFVVTASCRAWPIAHGRLSRVISVLPRITKPPQLAHLLDEAARCLAPGGRTALATTLTGAWRAAVEAQPRLVLEYQARVHGEVGPLDVIVLTRSSGTEGHRTPVTAGDRARASRGLSDAAHKPRPQRARRGKRPGR
jgi:hypothetical protein